MKKKHKMKFVRDLKSSGKYEILGEYKNSRSKILFKCNRCGTEFYATSRVISKKKEHCPNCLSARTPAKVLKYKFKDAIEVIDSNTVKYVECGHNITYSSLDKAYKSTGCDICNYSDDYNYYGRLTELYGNNWEINMPQIKNGSDLVKLKCKKCGGTVEYQLKSLVRGTTICRNCNPTGSSVEDEIYSEISKIYSGKIVRNSRFKNLNNPSYELELDFYIPEYCLGIEFDGMFWHSKLRKDKQYNKKDMFLSNYNINVIFITSYEWKFKKDIVLSKLNILLHSSNVRIISARKLLLNTVTDNIKDVFLERYHINGQDNSILNVGLYTKTNKLVALMTFKKCNPISSWDKDNNVVELSRFAARNNIIVNGGFSKLLKYSESILKEMGFNWIKTLADRRYSIGNLYKKCNFTLDSISEPNCYYFNNDTVISPCNCQKDKIKEMFPLSYSDNKTEEEILLENNFNQYYDCGNYIFYKEIE